MAKINHNNSLDTIDELFTDAKNRGIMHLVSNISEFSDRKLSIFNRELLNFGTCGYLGLELDQRLKDGAIEFTQKYGTQHNISRAYLASGIHMQLEEYLSQMFDNRPVLTFSSVASAHISVIPTLITREDAVILDQQVHMSVQTAAQTLRQRGTPIEMIRHSNLEMLEQQVIQLSQKHKKIWYMIDGVYSMYGDVPPIDGLLYLLDKYPSLHLYIDDSHGMSWHGKNGTGYINSLIPPHEKIMLLTTMSKGFGVTGGIAIFPNKESCRKVGIFGGPLVYSLPLTPPVIGAAIASAKIHLSDDINRMQKELRENVDYCNQLISKTDMTIMSDPLTPIFFVGMGQPKVGFNMVKRLQNEGFFVNLAIFPAVSVRSTGIRFTISRQVQKNEIKEFVDALAFHYPKVLVEEGRTKEDIQKAFKIKTVPNTIIEIKKEEILSDFNIQEERTIKNINKEEWNSLLGGNGSYDWEGVASLEDVFSGNEKPEDNLDFYYFIVRDKNKQPVLATFFTSGICKDDMIALESVSVQIEEKRKIDPYYLTSKTLMMGSLLTEGHHYYIDRNHLKWKDAFNLLLERVSKIQESINANTLLLRDFDKEDVELKELFLKDGFAPIDMPNSNVIDNMKWNTIEDLIQLQSSRNRKNIRTEVLKYENAFEIEYKKELTQEEADYYYQLYLDVGKRNRGLNVFDYPRSILKKLSKYSNWEFIIIKLKPEFDSRPERKAVAVIWTYVTSNHLVPMMMGMDYNYNREFKVYKQAIYQTLKRARMLNLSKVYLGLSADTDKHKFGAVQHARVAYLQTKDNYNFEVIESMAALTIPIESVVAMEEPIMV
jgi:7-keto-8-aminopelargonate synthetase-like enzyme